MTRKEEIEERLDALMEEIGLLHVELWKIEVDACPIKVGMVICHHGKEFYVVEIDNPEFGWVCAVPKRSDGSWGIARRHIFDEYKIVSAPD